MLAEPDCLSKTLGLILAGGRSSRMGVDKSTLNLAGVSFLQLAINRFESIGIKNQVISSNTLKGALTDRLIDKGPLAALDAVLSLPEHRLANVDSFLVVPIDMPVFPADSLKQLALQGRVQHSACYFQSHPMPFFIILDDNFKQTLNGQIQSNDRSIFSLLKKLAATEIELSEDQISQHAFYNVNTPEQMQQVKQMFPC
ncbi:molybdenum cofactor guanylyltransferase [Aliiglaciecola sp. 2_MG-2023]|uniref:molybdenum cofactor guanylyltransferase n=1 Tax=unclassified Aliiglaciecola TaxID=2593648 RepID=UPI0026E3B7B8|nr:MULTISPECIES: molybdenum cofactor guanylyltransferase [unclassified Aliiglaciecola]MDO6712101.1 molybdenum cofactor guanylyltransferase [Aliiglaciecola sp. 2_MG-2023]MDO6753181.1 molybdenum cofactor guanylyltransferase [Aliiglaciecola sp. 1_MG-2023]